MAEGDCGGSALDALLAADYRIIPAGAKLVVPVVAGATWPGMALYRLARQAAGAAQARRAALFGTPIEAAEALAMGLIDEVAENVTSSAEKAMEVAAAAAGAELAIRRQLVLEAPADHLRGRPGNPPRGLRPGAATSSHRGGVVLRSSHRTTLEPRAET